MVGRNMFCFKRFTIQQEGCAMKVGTDGVLLGAWCRIDPRQDKAILDIGTGTGLIALQLAQRTENTDTRIEAIEIDPKAHAAAQRNFEASEWPERLVLHPPMAVQEFARTMDPGSATAVPTSSGTRKFDNIVSNPPWFADSLSSPDPSRTTARHTATLSYSDLISVCNNLLAPEGRVSLILPAGLETRKVIAIAAAVQLIPTRLTEVHSTPQSGPKRTLLEFSRAAAANNNKNTITTPTAESTTLVIQDGGPGTFSAEYRALTADFYLYF